MPNQRSIVAPSILSADFSCFEKDLAMISESIASWIHIDIMDGQFVPPISFGDNIIKICKEKTDLFLDAHLMTLTPEKHLDVCLEAGADNFTFHYEASPDPQQLLNEINNQNKSAGLAVKLETDLDEIYDLLEFTDVLLVMSIEPGYSGQKFLPHSLERMKKCAQFIDQNNLKTRIQVDGGINLETGQQCRQAGASIFVAASYIFSSDQPIEQIKTLNFD